MDISRLRWGAGKKWQWRRLIASSSSLSSHTLFSPFHFIFNLLANFLQIFNLNFPSCPNAAAGCLTADYRNQITSLSSPLPFDLSPRWFAGSTLPCRRRSDDLHFPLKFIYLISVFSCCLECPRVHIIQSSLSSPSVDSTTTIQTSSHELAKFTFHWSWRQLVAAVVGGFRSWNPNRKFKLLWELLFWEGRREFEIFSRVLTHFELWPPERRHALDGNARPALVGWQKSESESGTRNLSNSVNVYEKSVRRRKKTFFSQSEIWPHSNFIKRVCIWSSLASATARRCRQLEVFVLHITISARVN